MKNALLKNDKDGLILIVGSVSFYDMAIHGGFMSNPSKLLGRPPKDYFKPDFNNMWHRVYVHIKINDLDK